jgi:hypothetical protein
MQRYPTSGWCEREWSGSNDEGGKNGGMVLLL